MTALNDKIIDQLKMKHDAWLGQDGQDCRDAYKSGLMWAIDTIETLTENIEFEESIDSYPKEEPIPEITEENIIKLLHHYDIKKGVGYKEEINRNYRKEVATAIIKLMEGKK